MPGRLLGFKPAAEVQSVDFPGHCSQLFGLSDLLAGHCCLLAGMVDSDALCHVLLQTVINKLFQMSDNLKSYEEAFYDSLKDETVSYFGEYEESQKVKQDIDKKCESLSTKRGNILNLSLLTDWIAPYTVLKNNHLDRLFRNSFLSTRFFLVSSLSMHTGTILTFAGILIGNPNMRTVQNLNQDSPMHCPLQNSTWNGKPCMNCSTFCS